MNAGSNSLITEPPSHGCVSRGAPKSPDTALTGARHLSFLWILSWPEPKGRGGRGRPKPFFPALRAATLRPQAPAFISQEAGRAAARAAARPCPSPPFLAQDHAPLGWAFQRGRARSARLRQLRQAGGRRGSCERQQARL